MRTFQDRFPPYLTLTQSFSLTQPLHTYTQGKDWPNKGLSSKYIIVLYSGKGRTLGCDTHPWCHSWCFTCPPLRTPPLKTIRLIHICAAAPPPPGGYGVLLDFFCHITPQLCMSLSPALSCFNYCEQPNISSNFSVLICCGRRVWASFRQLL